ncbi:MAG: DUF1810 domain-containing protein [Pseudanabaena sp. ELA645]|jgi:uncharacterized protein (DUF1810 family)
MNKDFHIERFLSAQNSQYESVLSELRSGQKFGHWMWYIFPQIKGLGTSAMAEKYGIISKKEAIAYFDHPILGVRLKECSKIVIGIQGRTAVQIFGYIDSLKFRSCMTLFAEIAPDCEIFATALSKYYDNHLDQLTINILNHQ